MSIASIAPLNVNGKGQMKFLPINILLKLNAILKKSVFSRKFYQEINDKVLSKSSTVDANLYFICYFTLLLSSILNNKPKIRQYLLKQKYKLVKVVNSFCNNTLGKAPKDSSNKIISRFFQTRDPSMGPPVSNDSDRPVSQLAVHLKTISSYIADVRIFNRLTESIKYMPWIIDEFYAFMNPASAVSKFDRFVNLLQSLNCLLLELLEHAGWLTDHNWVGTLDNNQWSLMTYVWCSRVWGAYLIIEIIELFRRVPMSKWDKNWRLSLFKQAVQVPLVVHWSLYEGCLSPFWVGLCGSGASWWNFRDMWLSIDLS
ncbi:unnamed protein product [Debaryomyces tyrocola]|nr:unnamed protein product [Debaryomyces tyrocola]